MKLSIVMAFYNRQRLLDKTLESIDRSCVKDYELIIVDDGSTPPLVCDRATILRVEPRDKWYYNSCIPFNIGLESAKGDIVVIQNPECYHVGDVLSYVVNNLTCGNYFSFACYALNKIETSAFHLGVPPKIGDYVFSKNSNKKIEYNGWYNHTIYRPVAYHFCSAIMKSDLEEIGGFDDEYASGIAYEDDDFIRRVRKHLNVEIVDYPYVIHQYHPLMSYNYPNMKQLHQRNKNLYNNGNI